MTVDVSPAPEEPVQPPDTSLAEPTTRTTIDGSGVGTGQPVVESSELVNSQDGHADASETSPSAVALNPEESGGPGDTSKQDPSISIGQLADLMNQNLSATCDFVARADFYEGLVRTLQQRVESLQTDQIQQLLSPVFQRLVILLTQAADSAELARNHGSGYQADVEFDYFFDAIVETLDLMGAHSVDARVGNTFDRALHAARKAVSTPDESLDGTIAKVMRQGLVRLGAERAFLPAQVAVYRYSPSGVISSESSAATAATADDSSPADKSPQSDNEGEL